MYLPYYLYSEHCLILLYFFAGENCIFPSRQSRITPRRPKQELCRATTLDQVSACERETDQMYSYIIPDLILPITLRSANTMGLYSIHPYID